MSKTPSILKSLFTLALCTSLLFVLMFAPVTQIQTPKAHAIDAEVVSIGAIEGTFISTALLHTGASTALSANSNITSTLIMQTLNGIAWKVAKDMLQSMSKSMLTWLNSGYSGAPAFVTDLGKELLKVSDTQATAYLNQLASDPSIQKLPTANKTALLQATSKNYFKSTGGGSFVAKNPYTLDKVAINDKACLKGDFSSCGWEGFGAIFTNDTNNGYALYERTVNDLGSQANGAAATKSKLIDQGQGWMPWQGNNCVTAASLNLSAASAGQGIVSAAAGIGGSSGSAAPTAAPQGQTIVNGVATPTASLSAKDNCLGKPIQTPATLLRDYASQPGISSLRTLENVHNINEIVAAFATQLIENTLNKGLAGLSKPSSGGGASPIASTATSAQTTQTNTALTQGIVAQVAQQKAAIVEYQQNWQIIAGAAQSAATACANNPSSLAQAQSVIAQAQSAQTTGTTYLANLNALETKANQAKDAPADQQPDLYTGLNVAAQTMLSSPGQSPTTLRDESRTQSTDTKNTTPVSLFTQMQTLTTSCTTFGGIH